jgi:hypothetical protein
MLREITIHLYKKKKTIYCYIEIMFLSFKEKTKNLDFGGNSVFSMTH